MLELLHIIAVRRALNIFHYILYPVSKTAGPARSLGECLFGVWKRPLSMSAAPTNSSTRVVQKVKTICAYEPPPPRVRSTENQRKQAKTPRGSCAQKKLKALLPQRSVRIRLGKAWVQGCTYNNMNQNKATRKYNNNKNKNTSNEQDNKRK
jgi:hypothetical protein